MSTLNSPPSSQTEQWTRAASLDFAFFIFIRRVATVLPAVRSPRKKPDSDAVVASAVRLVAATGEIPSADNDRIKVAASQNPWPRATREKSGPIQTAGR